MTGLVNTGGDFHGPDYILSRNSRTG